MFLDIHAHAQRVEGVPQFNLTPWVSARELLARYDELGIEKGVLLPLIGPEFYAPQSNQDIIEVCAAHPERFIPFCNIHPRAIENGAKSDFTDLLAYYRQHGCRGLGEVTANLPFSDPLVQNLFAQVEEAGLPVTIHLADRIGNTYGLYDEPGLPQFEAALQRFPDLIFLAHSQVFWAEIGPLRAPSDRGGYPDYTFREEGAIARLFRCHGNLYGDLSARSGYNALARNPDYAGRFLEEFQDRLLFGTDISSPDTPAPLAGLLIRLRGEGRISQMVFDKVARGNAMRILGIH